MKKYKQETIDKAFDLYDNIIEYQQSEKSNKQDPSNDYYMKYFGILSVASLMTLGLNYLIVKRNRFIAYLKKKGLSVGYLLSKPGKLPQKLVRLLLNRFGFNPEISGFAHTSVCLIFPISPKLFLYKSIQ